MPLMRVLQFCEHQGITGEIRVRTPDAGVTIRLRSGEIAEGDLEYLDRVFEVREGDFTIFVAPVDFGEIAEGAASRPAPVALEKPMGQLSGVRLDNRLFQIQTEFTMLPAPAYTTIVVLDGRTVHKKSTPADLTLARAAMEAAMSAQHQEIELNLRKKIGLDAPQPSAAPSPSPSAPASSGSAPPSSAEPSGDVASTAERCARLLDDGYEHLREKDYAQALTAWEQAAQLDPENRTLQLNLEILRKKME
jgi:hypothetical protein